MIKNSLHFIFCTSIVLLFIALSCKKNDENIGVPENYILTEKKVFDDCTFFQMMFTEGEYILKYSLAGSCKDLTTEKYLMEYSLYIEKNYNNLKYKKGYIVIDYYKVDNLEYFQDSIIDITENKLNSNVSLYESNRNSFTLILSNK